MNNLSRDQQIQFVACLTEGMSIRATERLTGIHRDTIMRLGVRVGTGCAELHDRRVVGLRVGRVELDELWEFVGKKQKRVKPAEAAVKGDAYTHSARRWHTVKSTRPIQLSISGHTPQCDTRRPT